MSFTVKAGTYWLGDPSCCFGDSWSKVLDDSDFFNAPYTRDDRVAIAFRTTYGDGCYNDQHGFSYGVDSGMIGLVPIQMAEKNPGDLSQKVTFSRSTKCCVEGGFLHFGDYEIDIVQ
jgi:hypothetical protein